MDLLPAIAAVASVWGHDCVVNEGEWQSAKGPPPSTAS